MPENIYGQLKKCFACNLHIIKNNIRQATCLKDEDLKFQ